MRTRPEDNGASARLPALARWLLRCATPIDDRNDVLGDLAEEFSHPRRISRPFGSACVVLASDASFDRATGRQTREETTHTKAPLVSGRHAS